MNVCVCVCVCMCVRVCVCVTVCVYVFIAAFWPAMVIHDVCSVCYAWQFSDVSSFRICLDLTCLSCKFTMLGIEIYFHTILRVQECQSRSCARTAAHAATQVTHTPASAARALRGHTASTKSTSAPRLLARMVPLATT